MGQKDVNGGQGPLAIGVRAAEHGVQEGSPQYEAQEHIQHLGTWNSQLLLGTTEPLLGKRWRRHRAAPLEKGLAAAA